MKQDNHIKYLIDKIKKIKKEISDAKKYLNSGKIDYWIGKRLEENIDMNEYHLKCLKEMLIEEVS